ncbi:MAG: hypothetical protein NVSMB6_02060 [Burkholderiaceae bacterium]
MSAAAGGIRQSTKALHRSYMRYMRALAVSGLARTGEVQLEKLPVQLGAHSAIGIAANSIAWSS